ncbi:MOSC domain-containing protein [Paraburkholderia heleia]|uniref:MOSC domain-containing protein n=1 Tax=Paraburkholderia heleia TaxID=634127 RepID=UPI0005AAAD62|nr:MOSC domain-containing protein [Paraburkholderia heleia]
MKHVSLLCRYPVKGLSAETLSSVSLKIGQGFPSDRRYAIANGEWVFDAAGFVPRPKTDYLALVKYERLAALSTSYSDSDEMLRVRERAGQTQQFHLGSEVDRVRFSDFMLRVFEGTPLPGRPELVGADGIRFTDVSVYSPALMNAISLINLATLRDLGRAMGAEPDPLRFRANVYFDNGMPWSELEWLDREVMIGNARARIVRQTRRCAATNVNPATAQRDLGIPQALAKHFGHVFCGVYAEIASDGYVELGDEIGPL